MKLATAACIISALTLSSCTGDGSSVGSGIGFGVSETAASKALPGAYSLALVGPDKVKPGHIYKVANGSYFELCKDDIRYQNALKKMGVEAGEPSPDVVEDTKRFSQAEISAFGLKIGPSYQTRKVTGFQTLAATTPSSGDVANYVLANVKSNTADSCSRLILPRNKPYFVVDTTVVGKKVEVTNRASFQVGASAGPVSGTWVGSDSVDALRTNVVFGATGRLVTK